MPFLDRADAGRRLAVRLRYLRGEDVVVLSLVRGGVPVAWEVARDLKVPLDVVVVRKLGAPRQPELALGAIGEGEVRVLNQRVLTYAEVTPEQLALVEQRERAELNRRARLYRAGRAPVPLEGRTAVVVDDGIATGSSARAACQVAYGRGAERVILAVPVASPEAVADLGRWVEVTCLEIPHDMWAVGEWYKNFAQVSDDEVVGILDQARSAGPAETRDGTVIWVR